MSNKVMINCDEASTICDKTQYNEATFLDKIKLQMHLFLCKKCGLYSEQNKMMSKLFNTHLLHQNQKHLCQKDKEVLKAELKHHLEGTN